MSDSSLSVCPPEDWGILGVIFKTFQGELRVETQQVLVRPDSGMNEKPKFDIDRGIVFF